jgi:hypothetical protein
VVDERNARFSVRLSERAVVGAPKETRPHRLTAATVTSMGNRSSMISSSSCVSSS